MSEATVESAVREPIYLRSQDSYAARTAAFAAIEMLAVGASAYGAFVGYNFIGYGATSSGAPYGWLSVGVAVIYGGLCLADDQYDLLSAQWNDRGKSRGLAAVALAFIFLLVVGFITDTIGGYSRGAFLTQLIIGGLVQFATRSVLMQVVDRARKRGIWRCARMVMLSLPGANWTGDITERLSATQEEIFRSYRLFFGSDGSSSSLENIDARIDQIMRECRILGVEAILIVFDKDNMDLVTRVVSAFSELPVRIKLLPIGIVDFMKQSRVGHCGRMRVLEVFCRPCSFWDHLLKRSFDIFVAITLGVLAFPLLVIVAILIKLDSKGPVLFRQTRHGFNNKPIRIFKFRSMATFDDERHGFRQAVRGDPRVTRIGRILRRTNIDELPQLINVIRGEMSIVGPRPHAVAHNEMYGSQIVRMSRRHNVKPGITGWAQVNGLRGETDTLEKMRKRVEYDIYYIDNWSLLLDLKIIIMTVLYRSAYANAY
jgi:Undecaprenyl-phosphate glucose phosphotransferase